MILAVVLLFTFAPHPVLGQTASESNNLSCLVELELPQFAVALMSPKGGDVDAIVVIGDDGQPTTVHTESTDAHLSGEVEYHLRKKAVYRSHCSVKEVRLQFTFRIEGTPVASPFTKVRFQPPNHFIILTQPVLCNPDFIPVGPAKRNSKKK